MDLGRLILTDISWTLFGANLVVMALAIRSLRKRPPASVQVNQAQTDQAVSEFQRNLSNVLNTQEPTKPEPGPLHATIGQYADFHSESWVIKDGQWVWNEEMFDSPEESARWKEHVSKSGGFFGFNV